MQSYNQEITLFLVSFVVLFIATKWLSRNSTSKKHRPPSPSMLPLIGNLHQFGMCPHRSLRALSQKYGDLLLLDLGRSNKASTLVVSSAELASEVLKTNDAFLASRPKTRTLRKLFWDGNDLFSSPSGERWMRMKRICIHDLLSKKRVKSFRNAREEEVNLMVAQVDNSSLAGGVVNLRDMFKWLTNDMICRVAFGRKYRGYVEGEVDFNAMGDSYSELIEGYYIGDFISWLGWIDKIKGVHDKVNKVAQMFDVFLERVIEERRSREANLKEGEEEDFINVLLQIQSQNPCTDKALDNYTIKCLLMNLFAAAIHTTGVSLEWMMTELVKNPRVMEEVRKEITMIIGNEKVVREVDLMKMNYLKAVLKETLRLHIPGPFLIPHESTHDVKINGFDIDTGTQVVVNAWSITRDPRYWEEPEKFHPERFLRCPRDFKSGLDFEFTPFGSGRRMCPASEYSTSIMELAIANLVLQFDWSLPNGEANESLDTSEAPGLLFIRKKKPLVVVASPRVPEYHDLS